MLSSLIKRVRGGPRASEPAAQKLYDAAVDQARRPELYLEGGVPDSVDGRFEMVVLHVYFILRRLKVVDAASRESGEDVSQKLFDQMFVDMDQSLREMGVSDLSVGKRVKFMAKAFFGRVTAYDNGLASDEEEGLASAIVRNVFGTVDGMEERVPAIARYMRCQAAHVDAQDVPAIQSGTLSFLTWADTGAGARADTGTGTRADNQTDDQ